MSIWNGRVSLFAVGVATVFVLLAAQMTAAAPRCCYYSDGSCDGVYNCGLCQPPDVCFIGEECSMLPDVLCKRPKMGCMPVNVTCFDKLGCTACFEPTRPAPTPEEPQNVCWADEVENVCWADDYTGEIEE